MVSTSSRITSLERPGHPRAVSAAAAALLLSVLGPVGSASAAVARQPAGRPSASAADDTSFVQNLLAEWDSFVARYAEPVGKLLLPFLGVLTVLLVVSRLIVFLVPRWRPLEDTVKVHPYLRRWAVIVGGICGLVLGSALLTFGLADVVTPPLSTAGTAVLLGVVVGAGVGALVLGAQLQRDIDRERRQAHVNEPERVLTKRQGGQLRTPATLMIVGFGLSAAAAAGLVIRFSGTDTLPRWMDVWGIVLLGVPIAALGAGLTAWWLATRVRLDIKVNDASGTEQSSLSGVIAAYLNELGAEKPRGLEVPRGTDVTALDGAFATMPDNPVLKAVKSFISGLAGVTPWAATVDQQGTCLAVSVRRNGRSEDSAVIDPGELLRLGTEQEVPAEAASPSSKAASSKPASSTKDEASEKTTIDPTDAALKFAAAHILTTMAEHHPSIEQGLARATNWRSVGLHYIATTEPSLEEPGKAQLLARALDLDHENLAARLAFRHAVDRQSVDPSVLDAYGQWLTLYLADLTRIESRHELLMTGLRIRALYVRAAIASNSTYAYAATTDPRTADRAEELTRRQKAVVQASTELQEFKLPGGKDVDQGLAELLDRAQEDARGLAYLVSAGAPEPSPQSVRGMYNQGCTLASRNDVVWPGTSPLGTTTDDAAAVKRLRLAAADPDNREWMKKDPQLTEFRQRKAYRAAFLSDPRKDFFELTAVKPFADRLRQAGLTHVELIRHTDPHDLPLHLLAPEVACLQIVDLAQLYSSLAELRVVPLAEALLLLDPALTPDEQDLLVSHWVERPLKWWALEILEELSSRGLASPAAFAALGDEKKSVAEEIAEKLLAQFKPETDTPEGADSALPIHLRIWMAAVVQPVG